jgi:hypothetical protein
LDGTLDQTFNTNAGTGFSYVDGSAIYMYTKLWISPSGKLYATGQADSYNGVPNNTSGGYLFMRINHDGTRDMSFNSGAWGINDLITSIQFTEGAGYIDEKLYVVGSFTNYGTPGYPGNAHRIISINSDGTTNTAANFGTGFNVGLNDMVLYDNKMYITVNASGSFDYNGTSHTGRIISINIDGTLNSTFNSSITTGFDGQCDALTADATGIYTTGEYTHYNGTLTDRLSKLNFDGTLNMTFNSTNNGFTPIPSDRIELLLADDSLYVWGKFDTYRGNTCHDLIKISKTDGSYISAFAVGSGFNDTTDPTKDQVITLFEVFYQTPPTLHAINTNFSVSVPCDAYCGAYNTVMYGDGVSLASSSILYSNSTGTSFAAQGYYSDGGTISQVNSNGAIISQIDIHICTCSTLNQFDTLYDADECTSCGDGVPASETVFGSNSIWSSNTVLYANNTGSSFAPSGWYTFNGIAMQVGTNGNVIATGDCSVDCMIPVTCAELRILNTSGQDNAYSYRDCTGYFVWGSMFPGETLFTGCIDINSFMATESYKIQRTLYC